MADDLDVEALLEASLKSTQTQKVPFNISGADDSTKILVNAYSNRAQFLAGCAAARGIFQLRGKQEWLCT